MRTKNQSVDIDQIKKDFPLIALETGHQLTQERANELYAWLKRLEEDLSNSCFEACESQAQR